MTAFAAGAFYINNTLSEIYECIYVYDAVANPGGPLLIELSCGLAVEFASATQVVPDDFTVVTVPVTPTFPPGTMASWDDQLFEVVSPGELTTGNEGEPNFVPVVHRNLSALPIWRIAPSFKLTPVKVSAP